MAQSFFQTNPDTGQPFTLEQAMQVGMPQGGGIGGGQPGMSGGLQDIMVNRQGVGGQMFGNNEPTGLAGLLGQQTGPDFAPVQAQAQPRKPNMLKNIGMGIFGGALDGVARWGGAQPGYANALERQQAEQQRLNELRQKIEAQSEQSRIERLTGLQDFAFKEQYKQENQGPTNAERELAWWSGLSADQRQALAAFKDVTNPIAVSGPTGTFRVPRGYGQASGGPQAGTVDQGHVFLGGDPANPDNWKAQ